MEDVKISIRSIIVYELIMIIGTIIMSSFIRISDNNLTQLISNFVIQLISSGYLAYIIKKFYKLENIGFSKINKDKLVWFVPYILILTPMLYKFIEGILKNISYFNSTTLISIILIFIGTVMAGFSEEIMFRGMLLNTLKGKIPLISAMIVSSLGFSFVPLAIILNNILPLAIFHTLWNFIIIASSTMEISISNVYLLCNPINIIISIILWTIIIKKHKKSTFSKNKLVFSKKLRDKI
ncbi:CPBP family intramembrane glutamic endopeptidase [Romboutsia ilealis]|uniref:CAAX prenyl protease 2/Lysostaphin resistance protein A-like domain-containing protein n=2 Tax=Romboutsia ilealis TaxID=1115758 RepID=A0A1V1I3I3_9FIRM|nr:CPBP family intramembrane glutamic endopeptidase [Romboutsia ilealis]CED93984.1 Hypothetical protein CRIB_1375 [Romboutsia ilealis]